MSCFHNMEVRPVRKSAKKENGQNTFYIPKNMLYCPY